MTSHPLTERSLHFSGGAARPCPGGSPSGTCCSCVQSGAGCCFCKPREEMRDHGRRQTCVECGHRTAQWVKGWDGKYRCSAAVCLVGWCSGDAHLGPGPNGERRKGVIL